MVVRLIIVPKMVGHGLGGHLITLIDVGEMRMGVILMGMDVS